MICVGRHSNATALSKCIAMKPFMFTNDLALNRNNFTRLIFDEILKKLRNLNLSHEANALSVFLISDRQVILIGKGPYVHFINFSQRKPGPKELLWSNS